MADADKPLTTLEAFAALSAAVARLGVALCRTIPPLRPFAGRWDRRALEAEARRRELRAAVTGDEG